MPRPKRPAKEKLRHVITLRLNDAQADAVTQYEEDNGIPASIQARTALVQWLKKQGYLSGPQKSAALQLLEGTPLNKLK